MKGLQNMKALYFDSPGDPSQVVQIGDFPVPDNLAGECLVKMTASSINPADFLFINGKYSIKPQFPHQIAGMDGVGVIEKANDGSNFKPGQRVAFRDKRVWAEYVAVPESQLIPIPKDLIDEKAAQLVLNPGTAWGLLQNINLAMNDWILLTAGASTVSKLVAQMARQKKINVIAVVRSVKGGGNLQELGVSHTIDLSKETGPVHNKILEWTGGMGVKGFLDSVGGSISSDLMLSMAKNGKVLIYGVLSNESVQFHNSTILYKEIQVEGFRIANYLDNLKDRADTFRQIIETIKTTEFRMDVTSAFPLDSYQEALAASLGEADRGKVLFRP